MKSESTEDVRESHDELIQKIYGEDKGTGEFKPPSPDLEVIPIPEHTQEQISSVQEDKYHFAEDIQEEETLSLQDKELELIKKSLERHNGKRKLAAQELGISERTLYRKIKQYDL
jgi:DNA-binding NtrC family response regulator